ncbi:MAG: MFS transporter [Polyangiales bacterium]
MASTLANAVVHRSEPERAAPSSLVTLLAAGAGLGASSLYYSQPLLGSLGESFRADARVVGLVPTLTQLGYALGILLLAPLGDRYDRRAIMLVKVAGLGAALLATAAAQSVGALLAACLAVGVTATLAQDIVPAAAAIAKDSERGRVVGAVMTGLLLGILLSRVASGLVGERFGWRAVYLVAAVAVAVVGAALARGVPRFAPTTSLSYGALLRSMLDLWKRHAPLRRAVVAQGLLSVAFSAFWSTLAMMLHARYGMGSAAAGAFGLAGAAGALAAPLAGRVADRRGTAWVTRWGALFATASFAAMGAASWAPRGAAIGLLVATTVAFDFGVQATLVGHQTEVYGLEPAARSRLNAVLLTGMFLGMASGAALGARRSRARGGRAWWRSRRARRRSRGRCDCGRGEGDDGA